MYEYLLLPPSIKMAIAIDWHIIFIQIRLVIGLLELVNSRTTSLHVLWMYTSAGNQPALREYIKQEGDEEKVKARRLISLWESLRVGSSNHRSP